MTVGARTGHRGNVVLALEAADPVRERAEPTDFREIYDQYFDFVWRIARRLGVDDRALDDAVQDVFLVVYRRLAEFEGRSSLKSWIFGIARRVARDHRRRVERKERGAVTLDELADPRAEDPREGAARVEAAAILHRFLDQLDDDKREVFVLAELEQMTVPEIADATGANVNTVYSRLRAGRLAFEQAVARMRARDRAGEDR
jgi:RNA polymerase sigma-70 factor, ECF subfamily